jgi:formylglycine-generating enzyme required for sulfatase activity
VPDPVPSTSAAPASELTVNGATLRFVALPAGTYKMGCSPGDDNCTDVEKVLNVAVDPFQISATEVTQAFWQATMGSNPSDFQGPMRPVHNVSWPEGVAFMERLNQHSHGFRYRLPTEAEWEYAARARSGTPDPLPGFAWFGLLSSSGSAARPQDVAGKKPNAWGLYDMLGNVAEWCEDWFSPNFQRVVRGGSWQDGPTSVRVSARSKALPSTRDSWIGLRVVRTAR